MVMITRGCEKKPQGVVSITRGGFTAREVTDVTIVSGSARRKSRSAWPPAWLSDGFASASSHVATLARQ
jgi:hypothetical protein